MDREAGRSGEGRKEATPAALPGIVIANGSRCSASGHGPTIHAFVWGGKVRPTPTLPFGRWKGAV